MTTWDDIKNKTATYVLLDKYGNILHTHVIGNMQAYLEACGSEPELDYDAMKQYIIEIVEAGPKDPFLEAWESLAIMVDDATVEWFSADVIMDVVTAGGSGYLSIE